MKLPLISLTAAATTTTVAPEIFGASVNNELIAQAVHVYRSNKRQGGAKALRRGEVQMTTKKIYKQKGTGNARHGAASAPIFVGGGVAHGPTGMENWKRSLTPVMARKALISTLSAQANEKRVSIVADLESLTGKTKEAAAFIEKNRSGKGKVTIVLDQSHPQVVRALRNIEGVQLTQARRINALEVAQSTTVIVMKPALDVLKARLIAKENA